jgi:TonB family protein
VARPLFRGTSSALFLVVLALPLCLKLSRQTSKPSFPAVVDAQVDSLAYRTAQQIPTANLDGPRPRVLVIDFTRNSFQTTSQLGALLADRFSDFLKKGSHNFDVLDRGVLPGYLKDNWINLDDLHSEQVCLMVARTLGATAIVRGDLSESTGEQLTLSLRVIGLGPTVLGSTVLAATDEMQRLFVQPGMSYSRNPNTIPDEVGVLRLDPGDLPDVTRPTCVTCPNPNFTDLLRKAIAGQLAYRESVLLSVIVTPEGKVASIYVLRGQPFGLTQAALDTVSKWQLKPALRNDVPLAVRTTIEVTFKTL